MDTEVPLPALAINLAWDFPGAALLIALGLGFAVLSGLFSYCLAAIKNIRAQQPSTARGLITGLVVFLLASVLSMFLGLKWSSLLMFDQAATPLSSGVAALLAMAEIGNALWPPLLATVLGVVIGSRAKLVGEVSAKPIRQAGIILSALTFGRLSIAKQDIPSTGGEAEPEFEITMASGDEVEAEEREYIGNILELGDTTAQEVMCPRTDVVAVDIRLPVAEILRVVAESRHSRFPVYEGSIDNVLGVLHLRDLFEHLAKGEGIELIDIRSIIHDCISIPASKKVDDAIKALQAQKGQLAVVMDEFGGTAGILTIEDLLEEIVGEIQDEHDDEAKQIQEVGDGIKIISGQILIDDLNELLGKNFEEEDVETLGGLVTAQLGHIPQPQESLEIENIRFTVLSVKKNRVGQVKVEITRK